MHPSKVSEGRRFLCSFDVPSSRDDVFPSNKKLLGTKGIATKSKEATSSILTTSNKKLLGARALLLVN